MASGPYGIDGDRHTEPSEELALDPRTIALGRSRLYQLFSFALRYPDEDFAALWRRGNYGDGLRQCARLVDQEQGGDGSLVVALEAMFRHLAAAQLDQLREAYRRSFGHTMAMDCAAYETLYSSGDIFQQVHTLADIAGWYRAFGLAISPEVKERLDHISVELEFMYVLTHKEAYALARDAVDKAQLCAETQVGFLQEHLGRWGPLFARLLGNKADAGLYQAVAHALEAFFALELERFGLDPVPPRRPPLGSVPLESELSCEECPLLR